MHPPPGMEVNLRQGRRELVDGEGDELAVGAPGTMEEDDDVVVRRRVGHLGGEGVASRDDGAEAGGGARLEPAMRSRR